jgi:hypothetical protein
MKCPIKYIYIYPAQLNVFSIQSIFDVNFSWGFHVAGVLGKAPRHPASPCEPGACACGTPKFTSNDSPVNQVFLFKDHHYYHYF